MTLPSNKIFTLLSSVSGLLAVWLSKISSTLYCVSTSSRPQVSSGQQIFIEVDPVFLVQYQHVTRPDKEHSYLFKLGDKEN